jgi:uncharacterized protein (TIGR02246 family)
MPEVGDAGAGDAVERQLAAYNARDPEAFAACYSRDVVVEGADGTVTMRGRDELQDAYRSFFAANPELHAEVATRIRIGRHVIDDELLTGRPAGDMRAVAIYHLDDEGRIDRVRFLV